MKIERDQPDRLLIAEADRSGLPWKYLVDDHLARLVPGEACSPLLARAWSYATLGAGKRVRPLLLLACVKDLGGNPCEALPAACAIELIHAASLILDDLPCMDDAKTRRGRPTLHLAFGESVAILTAVALVNEAHALWGNTPKQLPVRILAEAIGPGGLVAGQLRDLFPSAVTGPEIERTYAEKTGSLFVAACDSAGIIAAADAATRRLLREFAGEVGIAFQLMDDADDTDMSIAAAGKDIGQDHNVMTLAKVTSSSSSALARARHLKMARDRLPSIKPDGALASWLCVTFDR